MRLPFVNPIQLSARLGGQDARDALSRVLCGASRTGRSRYGPGMALKIGHWHGLIIDCPEPGELASFYQDLLGMIRVQDEADWVVIGDAPDRPGVAFQRVADFRAPQWPDAEHPQQMHVDVRVGDLAAGEQQVLSLGGRRLAGGGDRFRVFADPAGHPFCLVAF